MSDPNFAAGGFLEGYINSRRSRISKDREREDSERETKLRAYQHAVDNADKLGLTEDDLRNLYNEVGRTLGHKPDPKVLGLFQLGDKGDPGKKDLGDMMFPQSRRDTQVPTGGVHIDSSAPGKPFTPEEQSGMSEGMKQLGPAPEMITHNITQRRGGMPIADLAAQRQLATKQAFDRSATDENIRQAQETAKGQILQSYDKEGNLQYHQYDPVNKKMIKLPTEEGAKAVSTVDKNITGQASATKAFDEELNLINNDPSLKDLPEDQRRAIASSRVSAKHQAELEKTIARTKELDASTSLKRSREFYLSHPTPEQTRNFNQRQQGIEIRQAQLAINEKAFDNNLSKGLVTNLKDFQTTTSKALELINLGNKANEKYKATKAPADLAEAQSKWSEGYVKLSQAKIKAELMRTQYPGMVNVANTDPQDASQFPWVEVNYENASSSSSNTLAPKGRASTNNGKKRSFNPSPTTSASALPVEQYRELLKKKGLTPEQIEAKVKQYYPNQ